MRANYGKGLRHFISNKTTLNWIVDFGELPVFPEAATFPSVILTKNTEARKQQFVYAPIKRLSFDDLDEEVKSIGMKLDSGALGDEGWTLGSREEVSIFEKMKKVGVPLGEYVDGKIYRGVLTGFNEAFVIDRETRDRLIAEDSKSAEIIKPFVIGDDVRKYRIEFEERYLILTKIGVPIDRYPAVFKHLKKYQDKLEARWDKGEHWWELRPCDYYEEFEKPKIVWPEIAKESRFSFDNQKLYLNKTCFFSPTDDLRLLGILNSQVVWFFLKNLCSVLGDADKGGRLLHQKIYIEQIPIPKSKMKHRDMVKLVQNMLDAHKRKQEITKNYVTWLESVIGAKVDDLTNKESIRDPEKLKDISELIKLLIKNRNKLHGFDPKRLKAQEELKDFNDCKAQLEPVVAEIKRTDRAIDELVYKLYALTPEEIEIVEGRENPCED